MIKRGLAILLCLCLAFLPAISQAGGGTKVPGYYKSLTVAVPKPKVSAALKAAFPGLNFTVAPKTKTTTKTKATTTSAAKSAVSSSSPTAAQPDVNLTVATKSKAKAASTLNSGLSVSSLATIESALGLAAASKSKTTTATKTTATSTAKSAASSSSQTTAQTDSSLSVASSTKNTTQTKTAAKSSKKSAGKSSSSIDPDTLPVNIGTGQGIAEITTDSSTDTMVIKQNAAQAIQDWSSFNIGANATVKFNQKGNTSWVVLNNIYDSSPTYIFGKLKADGKIYLINQNGILFGQGSQVNVHTLIASSLSISSSDFMSGALNFSAQDPQNSSSVINQGTITTDNLGSVFLLGPTVSNSGTIKTITGQIGLAAGTDMTLYQDTSIRNWEIVDFSATSVNGTATNSGTMTANTGLIGMYGENVLQNGTISVTTGLKVAGEIELAATNLVSTGAGSVTSTPISTSKDKADQSFTFNGGTIDIMGLDPSNPTSPTTSPQQVVNGGLIQANSGTVTINAENGVTLESGSSIDVSGVWVKMLASKNTTKVQLNSVELADYPDQKSGILKGRKITVDNLLGSSIGNISGYLDTQQKTAMQRSVTGGKIYIAAPYTGDVTVEDGASLNFSGGGTRYTAGNVTTTALICGNKTYDISSAPDTLTYTGVTTTTKYMSGYKEGADAGLLSLQAGKVVLDGSIQGGATAGAYQTRASELYDKMGNQKTLGLQAPAGGTLIIGVQPNKTDAEFQDFVVNSVDIYGPNDVPNTQNNTSYISAQKLSAAGLSYLEIAADTTLTVMPDANITLAPGLAKLGEDSYTMATVSLAARSIDFQGTIDVPSGNINLTVSDNVTAFTSVDGSSTVDNSRYVSLDSKINLEAGSQIIAAGQRVDNSLAAKVNGGAASVAYTAGGSVSIFDESYFEGGVVSATGSTIDVSGGYGISRKGVVTGGDAGSLSIQGAGIVLDGTLRGYSIQGNNGGSITLHAQSVTVASSVPSNPQENLDNNLILGQDQLDDTGFTQISLQSVDNTKIEAGVSLSPSLAKLVTPIPGAGSNGYSHVTVPLYLVGSSSFSATAESALVRPATTLIRYVPNPNTNAQILVDEGASVNVAPGGKISLNAPWVTISGALSAPAGTIGITTTGDLTVKSGATISAAGYNKPSLKPVMKRYPVSYTALAGGTVSLTSSSGFVITETGSSIDVSGSSPVKTYLLNGKGVPVARTVASNPGSVSISANALSLKGTLKGQANLTGLQGGTLSITDLNSQAGYTLTASDIQSYLSGGFDALTFASYKALVFSGPMNLTAGRSLTFDAPALMYSQSDQGQVTFTSPYIQLNDTYTYGYVSGQSAPTSSGNGQLTLNADWIGVEGSLSLPGFQGVTLSAAHDITLSDYEYAGRVWEGQMQTPGSLTLQADRIYPTTYADFTVDSGGKVTILGSSTHNTTPVYSAGGSLVIDAQSIDMEGGYLDAPMGQISLYAPTGRVYLSGSSNISTAGSIAVNYGSLDDVFWTVPDKVNSMDSIGITVTAAPQGSVNISGSEVIMKSGANINVSGGGSVYSYQFQSGIQGTVDPLQTTAVNSLNQTLWKGRYVIIPGANYSLPGQAVYLQGTKNLKAGVYTLLPEQYAFLPGAMVITDTGTSVVSGTKTLSSDGYPIVAGYYTYNGTSIRPSIMEAFEVQPAKVLLNQGTYDKSSFVAGNAGSVAISAGTTVVDGTIQASALKGYEGGFISLSGTNAFIEASTTQLLPTDFKFNTPVSEVSGLAGTLQIAADSVSGKGFKEISIGDTSATDTVTMEPNSVLKATEVVLSAKDAITLDSGAQIVTVDSGGNGSTSLNTPNGTLNMQQNSLVHASDSVTMTIGQLNFQGDLQIDKGTLNLTGQNVYFLPQGYSQSNPAGLDLTQAFWSKFGSIQDVNLTATAGLVEFLGGMNLSSGNSFTINAVTIKEVGAAGGSVVISSPVISLLNTSGNSASSNLQNTGSLTLNANWIYVGEGALLLDGFASSNFNALKDITFQGAGSLTTAGDLNFSSARITTSYYEDASTSYTAANFQINAGGNVTIQQSGGNEGQTTVTGGNLSITGWSIYDSGIIDVPSGYVTLTSTSWNPGDGIFLRNGSAILALANEYGPGGDVSIVSNYGVVSMAQGALIDVHAPSSSEGDAGSISISCPIGGATLSGTFSGASQPGGSGGSFSLDTHSIGDGAAFSALYAKLGDFAGAVDIRTRDGDLVVNPGVTITSRQVELTSDSGNIDLYGTINASISTGGGSVELNAGQDLTLHSGSSISACGTGTNTNGGQITLNTQGALYLEGAALQVAGSGSGTGGTVHFRAPVSSSDVNMVFSGTNSITGAKQILAEGYTTYSYQGDKTISSTDLSNWQTGISTFMNNYASSIQNRLVNGLTLDSSGAAGFSFVPGLEVDSTGKLTLNYAWNLSSWRFGSNSVPGMLTLRATGDLNISQNLYDAPTSTSSFMNLYSSTAKPSWGMTLVAGADLASSDSAAFVTGNGNLTIGTTGKWVTVYTESGPLRLAAGDDIIVNTGSSTVSQVASRYMINSTMSYNIGTYSGDISVTAGHDVTLNWGGIIQSAVGDIDVNVGNDLTLWNSNTATYLGAIRTTGEATGGKYSSNYLTYGNGGNITVRVQGDVDGYSMEWTSGSINRDGWDSYTTQGWSASYVDNAGSGATASKSTAGLATMAGGNLTVYTGGSFTCQAGTFGRNTGGNLTIFSGGDIQGRFLIADGTGTLNAMGNFGGLAPDQTTHLPIELFSATLNVTAQGDIIIGDIVNPTITRPVGYSFNYSNVQWNLEYSPTASASLTSAAGNVWLYGDDGYYGDFGTLVNRSLSILPPTVNIAAVKGNINILSNFTLAPYAKGNLSLIAGGNINGGTDESQASIVMSEMSDALSGQSGNEVYGYQKMIFSDVLAGGGIANDTYLYDNPYGLLHASDSTSVVVSAGGNISNLALYIPKQADIIAAGDISNVFYYGHNNSTTDATIIQAGGNLVFNSTPDTVRTSTGIEVGGPGALVVEAGLSIDLGTSAGIKVVGNTLNIVDPTQLPTTGCTLVVAAGYAKDFSDTAADTAFFQTLQTNGTEYSKELAAGNTSKAQQIVASTRTQTIDPFLAKSTTTGSGDIDMTASQISTLAPSAGIFIFTNGDLNVGKSTFFTKASDITSTGIFTAQGGGINIFANKDINVNESRIMTFEGGDITVWTDKGNINAGRGSKTAVNASPPANTMVGGQMVVAFSPPSVGSGIRAVTYDPGWGIQAPAAGDIYMFAPQGVIDAGEAGIAGRNVILGAVQVLNAQNIVFSAGSVGVPVTSEGFSGLSALAGMGSVTQEIQAQEAAVMNAASSKLAPGASDSDAYSASWLEVKVLSFFEVNPGQTGAWESTDN